MKQGKIVKNLSYKPALLVSLELLLKIKVSFKICYSLIRTKKPTHAKVFLYLNIFWGGMKEWTVCKYMSKEETFTLSTFSIQNFTELLIITQVEKVKETLKGEWRINTITATHWNIVEVSKYGKSALL